MRARRVRERAPLALAHDSGWMTLGLYRNCSAGMVVCFGFEEFVAEQFG